MRARGRRALDTHVRGRRISLVQEERREIGKDEEGERQKGRERKASPTIHEFASSRNAATVNFGGRRKRKPMIRAAVALIHREERGKGLGERERRGPSKICTESASRAEVKS